MAPSNPPKNIEYVTVSFRITRLLDETLEYRAKQLRVTKSQIIRDGLANLNSLETGKAA
jgi:predicted DNA-binding protein